MTPEFEKGMQARERGLQLVHNPYSFIITPQRYIDWINGWRLEDWRRNKMGHINREPETIQRRRTNAARKESY